MTATLSVRTRIKLQVVGAVRALPLVGSVSMIDPLAMSQGGRSTETVQEIRTIVAGGGIAAEIDFGPDEEVLPEAGGARKLVGVEPYQLDCAVTAHLPDPLPEDPDNPGTKLEPDRVADDFWFALLKVIAPIGVVSPQVQCGRWLDLASVRTGGTGEALAQWTDPVMGGALGISDLGTRVCANGFTIQYRMARGDPGRVA